MSFLGSIGNHLSRLSLQLSTIDLDEVFCYYTLKEVRMLDRRLGLLCWAIRLLVLMYVVGYVFIHEEGFTQREHSVGHVVTEVKGNTYSLSRGVARPWDMVDAIKPTLEEGGLFIATHAVYTPLQRMGNCSSPSKRCAQDADCEYRPPLSAGRCTAGMCLEMQWCPAQSETSTERTSVHLLEGADDFRIWFKGSINFASLDERRIFSTIDDIAPRPYRSPSPAAGDGRRLLATAGTYAETAQSASSGGDGPPNQFLLSELLMLAGTSFESVKRTGCVLSVSQLWNCFVDNPGPCVPTVHVERLDRSSRHNGFSYQHANYYRTSPSQVEERDLYTFRGVRLVLSSRGVGKKVSIGMIMLQISSGIALLWLANYAADFFMLNILPERRHYRTYKQERTPDFSDLRNKITEVAGERKKLRERKNRFAAKINP